MHLHHALRRLIFPQARQLSCLELPPKDVAIEIAQLPAAGKRATLQPFLVLSCGPQLFLPWVTVFFKFLDAWPARLRSEVAGAIRREGASAAFAWLLTKAIIGFISVASSSAAARCSR